MPGINALADRFELLEIMPPPKSPDKKAVVDSSPAGKESGSEKGAKGPEEKTPPPSTAGEYNAYVLKLGTGETSVAFYDLCFDNMADREGAREGLAAISRIKDMLAERGADLLVCYIPSKFLVYHELLVESYPDADLGRCVKPLSDRWYEERPKASSPEADNENTIQVEWLTEYFEKNHIPFLDLTTGMKARASERLLYYENDTHFNQAGHDLVAELIADEINRLWPGRFSEPKK